MSNDTMPASMHIYKSGWGEYSATPTSVVSKSVEYTRTDLVDALIEETELLMGYLSEHRDYKFITTDVRLAIAAIQEKANE